MKAIVRCFVYITIGIGVLMSLDCNFKMCLYIAIGLFFVLLLGGLSSSKLRTDILVIGGLYYALLFGYMFCGGIHIKHIDNHVEVYSPLWQKLEDAERIDTLQLRTSVELMYTLYSERKDEVYFLKQKDSIFVYNRYRKILTMQQGKYNIIQREYYGVLVDLIDNEGKIYSCFDGARVDSNSKWKPYVRDVTPIEPSI